MAIPPDIRGGLSRFFTRGTTQIFDKTSQHKLDLLDVQQITSLKQKKIKKYKSHNTITYFQIQ